MPNLTLFADGACEPRNPGGYATWGWIARQGKQRIASGRGCVGYGPGMTNNIAEYQACIEAVTWTINNQHKCTSLYTDSMLVVEQVNGRWRTRKPHLRVLCAQLQTLLNSLGCTITWIPRLENQQADTQSKIAYREARKSHTPCKQNTPLDPEQPQLPKA